jgi:ABC-2 type transport system permease protein
MHATAKLVRSELRLVLREPMVLAIVFAFPVVTVLVIAGSFSADDADTFSGIDPTRWYVASYLAVVMAAIGLVMVPVHLATYRERGVLRRFSAAGFAPWSFAVAQVVVGVLLTLASSIVLLAVAGLAYGLPPLGSPVRVVAAAVLGATACTSIGLVLGTVLPNARVAQGVGLLLFFPSFLLGGGGPPPDAMGSTMEAVSNLLPLTHVTGAMRDPWLGLGTGTGDLVVVAVVLVASALWCRRSLRL